MTEVFLGDSEGSGLGGSEYAVSLFIGLPSAAYQGHKRRSLQRALSL